MIVEIRAYFEWDNCGEKFSVTIDPADMFPTDWSAMDIAVDAVRGARGYQGPTSEPSSVQHGKELCGKCTAIFDSQGE